MVIKLNEVLMISVYEIQSCLNCERSTRDSNNCSPLTTFILSIPYTLKLRRFDGIDSLPHTRVLGSFSCRTFSPSLALSWLGLEQTLVTTSQRPKEQLRRDSQSWLVTVAYYTMTES